MKNLDLSNYGVQEMDAKAMEKVDGGIPVLAIIGFVCLGYYIGRKIADAIFE